MRVSTAKQGRSGLGLDAQRAALVHFAQTERFHIVHEFVEVDSVKGHDALTAARSSEPRWRTRRSAGVTWASPSWIVSVATCTSSAG
jgi:hypothetical protein